MRVHSSVQNGLICLALVGLSACSQASEGQSLRQMADQIAAIPVDGPARHPRTAAEAGLRPALEVQVMDPHALWDARDGGLRPSMRDAVDVAAPQMVQAAFRQDSAPAAAPRGIALRPVISPERPEPRVSADTAPATGSGLVQLGAFASEAAARAAWERLKSGEAAWALEGLSPTFEAVEVNGRPLVRLKTRAPGSGGPALCAAAGIDDPWCQRAR